LRRAASPGNALGEALSVDVAVRTALAWPRARGGPAASAHGQGPCRRRPAGDLGGHVLLPVRQAAPVGEGLVGSPGRMTETVPRQVCGGPAEGEGRASSQAGSARRQAGGRRKSFVAIEAVQVGCLPELLATPAARHVDISLAHAAAWVSPGCVLPCPVLSRLALSRPAVPCAVCPALPSRVLSCRDPARPSLSYLVRCVCLPPCLPVHRPLRLPVCRSASLPVCLSASLPGCLPLFLPACPPVCLPSASVSARA
jgi:hypothetical protein